MRLISCHDGKLQTLSSAATELKKGPRDSFVTGLEAIDALAPGGALSRGAMHELLFDPRHGQPNFVAAMFAAAGSSFNIRCSMFNVRCSHFENINIEHPTLNIERRIEDKAMPIIWCDPRGEVYPPALASLGFDLSKVYLLHAQNQRDESWAVTECLRCRGVGAVIASPSRLTRIEARRLQLAAETGGTIGLLLRPRGRGDSIYAAATRWLVQPVPGERTIQRWTIQLLHGHGGRIGSSVFVEWCRETNSVRAVEKLADRSVAAEAETRVA